MEIAMKRGISFLLALVFCLSLCACTTEEPGSTTTGAPNTPNTNTSTPSATNPPVEINILGKWVWVGDNTQSISFLEDDTCTRIDGTSVSYVLDRAANTVTLTDDSGKTEVLNIVVENEITKLSGEKAFVREENYDQAHRDYLNAQTKDKLELFNSGVNSFLLKYPRWKPLNNGSTLTLSDNAQVVLKDIVLIEKESGDGNTQYYLDFVFDYTNTSSQSQEVVSPQFLMNTGTTNSATAAAFPRTSAELGEEADLPTVGAGKTVTLYYAVSVDMDLINEARSQYDGLYTYMICVQTEKGAWITDLKHMIDPVLAA